MLLGPRVHSGPNHHSFLDYSSAPTCFAGTHIFASLAVAGLAVALAGVFDSLKTSRKCLTKRDFEGVQFGLGLGGSSLFTSA